MGINPNPNPNPNPSPTPGPGPRPKPPSGDNPAIQIKGSNAYLDLSTVLNEKGNHSFKKNGKLDMSAVRTYFNSLFKNLPSSITHISFAFGQASNLKDLNALLSQGTLPANPKQGSFLADLSKIHYQHGDCKKFLKAINTEATKNSKTLGLSMGGATADPKKDWTLPTNYSASEMKSTCAELKSFGITNFDWDLEGQTGQNPPKIESGLQSFWKAAKKADMTNSLTVQPDPSSYGTKGSNIWGDKVFSTYFSSLNIMAYPIDSTTAGNISRWINDAGLKKNLSEVHIGIEIKGDAKNGNYTQAAKDYITMIKDVYDKLGLKETDKKNALGAPFFWVDEDKGYLTNYDQDLKAYIAQLQKEIKKS